MTLVSPLFVIGDACIAALAVKDLLTITCTIWYIGDEPLSSSCVYSLL